MAKGVISASDQAEQLKQDGNLYFKKNRLGAAIDAYTEAITLCPNVPVYWTNRALCHLKRNDWKRVEEDCLKAVQLDHKSVKLKESDVRYRKRYIFAICGTRMVVFAFRLFRMWNLLFLCLRFRSLRVAFIGSSLPL
nr:E3 ubiquitin-protein ligase CHIP-like [Tanacetum cinerariifolium]GEW31533.1 E3 ubiquitin-protein ligase CHIP-like [Tanacetum cinerariifolium]